MCLAGARATSVRRSIHIRRRTRSGRKRQRPTSRWWRCRAAAPAPLPEASGPSVEDIEAKLGSHAPKDSPLARSLTQLMRADPGFDPGQFLDGAKSAYEMIVMSFAEGDEASLSSFSAPRCSRASRAPSASARRRGEKVESNLVGINKADIIESDVKKNTAYVTVKFVSELISVTRDAEGDVVEGDPKKVREVTDIWTFARDISSKNPNWKLVATESAN